LASNTAVGDFLALLERRAVEVHLGLRLETVGQVVKAGRRFHGGVDQWHGHQRHQQRPGDQESLRPLSLLETCHADFLLGRTARRTDPPLEAPASA